MYRELQSVLAYANKLEPAIKARLNPLNLFLNKKPAKY